MSTKRDEGNDMRKYILRACASVIMVVVMVLGFAPVAANAATRLCSEWELHRDFRNRACVVLESATRIAHEAQIQNLGDSTTGFTVGIDRSIAPGGTGSQTSRCMAPKSVAVKGGQTRTFICHSARVTGYHYSTWAYFTFDVVSLSPAVVG
jgi:hypothetical protein